MSIGKTQISFRALGKPNLIAQFTHETLCKYGYERYVENNMIYYSRLNVTSARYNIEVFMQGNDVTVFAYLGDKSKPVELKGFKQSADKEALKNEVNAVIREVNELCNQKAWESATTDSEKQMIQNQMMQNNAMMQTNMQIGSSQSMSNTASSQTTGKKMTVPLVAAIILAVMMTIVPLINISFDNGKTYYKVLRYGLLFLVASFYPGIKGLKTSQKVLAIVVLVLATLGVIANIIAWCANWGINIQV